MFVSEPLTADARPAAAPRPVVWLLLTACAVAILAIGAVTTAVILGGVQPEGGRLGSPLPRAFWGAIALGAVATCASLSIRTIRWIFLLRRASARIPLRDACIGYLAGFSLLFVPLLVGEIVVRAAVLKSRARVPLAATAVVNLWERLLDVSALALIAAVGASLMAGPQAALIPLTIVALTSTRSFRRFALSAAAGASNAVVRRVAPADPPVDLGDLGSLASHGTWLAALAASAAAWALPALALWALAASWSGSFGSFGLPDAQLAYASSALTGGFLLAPGGVRVVGGSLLAYLAESGLSRADAAMTVLAVRLVTAGLATILGAIFVWAHLRAPAPARASHFDDISRAYDAQIPAPQREALLIRKTALMRDALTRLRIGPRGLDVGCGQGWYVARMRELGYDVRGIDASAGQIALARGHVDDPAVIAEGTALRIDAADASYDFAYSINVLHHLASVPEQRAAFAEIFRVLKPGGLVFVHEINTRNVLFRFYMGYVFPTLNCIDEGTERWLLPHRLQNYTSAPVISTSYFTFMPEFVPGPALRLVRPVEALLEASPLRVYSAHYMAVLQKPGHPA
jgi:2-polyprenyl-3-methyl-5-hydroxy-6-metoxy-1,4-benzoquinol methylase/uncharacterized membrane protein YbhN (UPF0104 family)